MQEPPRTFSADAAAALLAAVRRARPRVHCITNTAAIAFSANMLLAAGAVPSMTIATDEVTAFAGSADALLVNLGTLDPERRAAIPLAIDAAAQRAIPWVLDPVFVERSPPRAALAQALIGRRPAAMRANAGEFAELAPDALDPAAFAAAHRLVVARTGVEDIVTDGARTAVLKNGHPLMALVTAVGCAGSALAAAFLAVGQDRFLAVAGALTVLGVAGEVAAERSMGPGTFAPALLDAVHALDAATLRQRARVT